jgi:hypothetical protein
VFDGVDDFVNLGNPSSLQFGNTFSFGCWFYWTNTNTLGSLMGKRNGSSAGYNQFNMVINGEQVCCSGPGKNLGICLIADNSCSYTCETNYPLPNFAGWVYGFFTVGTNEQKLYINGSSVLTFTTNLTNCTFNVPTRSFYVGAIGGQTEGEILSPFNNKIAVAQVYNRTLSSSEVLQNYLAIMNPKFIFGSNLKIWYDMSLQPSEASVDNVNTIDSSNNLVTLSRVYDLSGNGKHLTQTTKVKQPTFIPNAQNGRPANYNTGGNWFDADATVMYSPNPGLTTGARSFFIVLKGTTTSAFSWDRGGGTAGSLQLGYAGGTGWNDLGQDRGFSIPGGNSTTTYVMSYLFDTTQSIFYRNGNLNRTQTNNTYTLNGNSFGSWTTAPSAGNQEGYWYEMVFLNKIPTISEYNTLVTYLGTKWGVSYGTLTNYN